jgi:putative protease
MISANGHAGRKPELLSPAGSAESFFAAIEHGADAVYVGLRAFSARARAANFTIEELTRMAALCRREGRRLYVTLNTLVKERELPDIVPVLASLAEARVDALIVQDLGLARIVSEDFPSLPLHASTQMTIHSIEGVRQAAALGFQRVVLARELPIPEIRSIVAGSPIEIECFIHGALCFCVSGQCLFSSFFGGRSGNRGDCAQPCRWRYRSGSAGEYPFSTRDLWGVDAIPALAAAGVSCLKIEGRMKPAGYVAAVTAAYRRLIDAAPEGLVEARKEAMALLSQSRGRTGTAGFLVEGAPEPLTDPGAQGVVGKPLGVVESASASGFTFVPSERFHAGDRLRVMPSNDRKGRTFTVRGILAAGREGTVAQAGVRVTVPAPFRFSPGDAVYRTVDGASGSMSEAACLRKLAAIPAERISCNVSLSLDRDVLKVCGATDDLSYEMEFTVGPLDPARGDRSRDVLRARFAETGDSPFALAAFDAARFGDRFIPPSRLKEIRRSFYEGFARAVLARREAARRELDAAVLRSIATVGRREAPPVPQLWIGVESPEEIRALDREGVDGFLVPLRDATIRDLQEVAASMVAIRERIVWRLPLWLPGVRATTAAAAVDTLLSAGFRRFEASNPAHFRMLEGKGAQVVAGWRLGTMNSAALRSFQSQGAAAAILSPEDDGVNLEALLAAELPIARWVTLFGRVPLMVSRIPVGRAGKETMQAAQGNDAFEVAVEDGMTVLRAGRPASIIGHADRLLAAGCEAFVVELAGSPRSDWPAVLESVSRGTPLPGASAFNFERGPAE